MRLGIRKEGENVVIEIEDVPWRALHRSIFSKQKEAFPRCSSREELAVVERKAALLYTYKLLALRSRLTSDIEKRLAEKGVSQEAIASVVLECERLGYLDDDRELRALIQREIRRGKGPEFIKQKIRHPLLIDELFPRALQIEHVQRLIEKKSGHPPQKVVAFLLRRGFTYDTIRECLREVQ